MLRKAGLTDLFFPAASSRIWTRQRSYGAKRTKNNNQSGKEELLRAARLRVNLPPGELWLDYQDDVDTLYIRLKEKTQPTHSKSDVDDLVVFDYEGEELVGIEIMDVTGQLKYANPS